MSNALSITICGFTALAAMQTMQLHSMSTLQAEPVNILRSSGYEPYHKLNKDIVNVGCWAHLRRKFMDVQKAMPKGKSAANTAINTALGFCTKIFKEDKRINTLALEKRYEERQKHLKPLLDDFYAWAKTVNATPKGALGKALTYLKNQWPYLN